MLKYALFFSSPVQVTASHSGLGMDKIIILKHMEKIYNNNSFLLHVVYSKYCFI